MLRPRDLTYHWLAENEGLGKTMVIFSSARLFRDYYNNTFLHALLTRVNPRDVRV